MGEVQRLTNCTTGGPVFVDVQDGKIVRMYPIDLADDDKGDWVIEARGRKFMPPRRTTLSPHAQAQRSMVYSPKRILTPLKRVDWDPEGERNTQNRGISGYEEISWDEALDLVTTELIREKRENGPGSILTTCSSHHLWGNLGYRHSAYYRFLNLMGMVHTAHNPDSWEGWHWGAMPMWGNSHRLGIPEQYDLLEDALKHTEMVVFWSADPESTGGGIYSAFESTSRRYWMKELGIKMVFVDPYYNPTAELFSDKWFAPRLGTDVAFGLGIAHTWLVEDLYDKEYVAERTTGFDEWKDYVLGKTDDVPKTPEWAESECGIPARQIRALAREWGTKKVMLAAGGLGGWGGACRSATGNEWARTMVALAAMQGYGKPGVNIWGTSQGAPSDCSFVFPGYAEGGMSGDPEKSAAGYRMLYRIFAHSTGLHPTVNAHDSTEGIAIPRLRIPEAMMHEKFEWRGKGFCGPSIQSQMQKYQYPAPGYPFVTMYWRYGGSFFGTMQQTNRYVKAYREGERAHRRQPVDLDGGRGQVRRHHPAGLHQLRALGHERVRQLLGLHPGQPQPDQPPGHRLPEEVHRAARREQVGLRHLRRRRRAHGHGRRLHRGRHGRARLVQGVLRRDRPPQDHHLGGVREEGLRRRAVPRRLQEHAGHALVRRGPQARHARLGPAPRRHRRVRRACRRRRARSSS